MQWWASRSSSAPAKQDDSVNALLQASRLAQRREGSSANLSKAATVHHSDSHANPGLLFLNSEDLQIASKHRRQTAGPIPQSWSKEIVNVRKASNARRDRRKVGQQQSSSQEVQAHRVFRPSNLREECMKRFLIDMATGGSLLDEAAFMPMHIKLHLIDMAPKVAPLNDGSLDALLLEPEDLAQMDNADNEDDTEDWETAAYGADLLPERRIERLNLSNSCVSVGVLRQVMLQDNPVLSTKEPILRLPMLRSLDLSSSTLAINAGLLVVLSHCPLRQLSLANLSCSLYLPLQSIALALPTLEYLDISSSQWLEWDHIVKLDWKSLFIRLATLKITDCEGLAPNATFLDPEGKSRGPAVILQAMSAIREAGRLKWLEIIA